MIIELGKVTAATKGIDLNKPYELVSTDPFVCEQTVPANNGPFSTEECAD